MGSFNDIFAEVKERLGGRTNIDTRLARWINDAYYDLLMAPQFTFDELIVGGNVTTAISSRAYNLYDAGYTDFWYMKNVRNFTTNQVIDQKDIKAASQEIIDFPVGTVFVGQPRFYLMRTGGEKFILYLYPAPDAVYVIAFNYMKRPPELSVGTSTVLPREWDEPIILLSTVKGYEALEQPDKAKKNLDLYNISVRTREERWKLEQDDREPTIYPHLEGGW